MFKFYGFPIVPLSKGFDIGKLGIILFSPRFPMAPSSRRVIDLEILWLVVKIKKTKVKMGKKKS